MKENLINRGILWRKKKLEAGWQSVYMIVPSEIAEKIKSISKQLKIDNNHLYRSIQ